MLPDRKLRTEKISPVTHHKYTGLTASVPKVICRHWPVISHRLSRDLSLYVQRSHVDLNQKDADDRPIYLMQKKTRSCQSTARSTMWQKRNIRNRPIYIYTIKDSETNHDAGFLRVTAAVALQPLHCEAWHAFGIVSRRAEAPIHVRDWEGTNRISGSLRGTNRTLGSWDITKRTLWGKQGLLDYCGTSPGFGAYACMRAT